MVGGAAENRSGSGVWRSYNRIASANGCSHQLTESGYNSVRLGRGCGRSNHLDEAACLVRCQLINADLEAAWAVRIKVREAQI